MKSAGIKLTPETYIAKAWVKAGFVLLSIIPALFLLAIICPLILFLSVITYFKETKRAYEAVMKRRKEIEYDLPRFVSTLTQELRASRDVLSILERYRKNAGGSIKKELDITIADMKTGSYEAALYKSSRICKSRDTNPIEIELNTADGNAHDESDSSKWFMDHYQLNTW